MASKIARTALPTLEGFRSEDLAQTALVKRFQGERLKALGSRLTDSDWRNAVLLRADLSGAFLELMDLALTDLRLLKAEGTTFKRTVLTDADAKGIQAKYSEWGGVNGDYADFSFAYSAGVDADYRLFKSPDFTGAIFHHVVTDPITFKYTPVENSFDGTDFRGAQFPKAQLVDFTARWANFTAPKWLPAQVPQGQVPEELRIPHSDWEAYDKPPVDFSGATFEKVNLQGSNLSEAKFVNVQTQNHRLSIHRVVPQGQIPNAEKNEVSQAFTQWLRPFRQPCPPVNLEETILKKTVWDDTVLNRGVFEQENTLEKSFDFKGAFADGADFRKAKVLKFKTKEALTVENAVKQVLMTYQEDRLTPQGLKQCKEEQNTLKQQLKGMFEGMHYEHNLPLFHSDEAVNETFANNTVKMTKQEMKKDD